ncbi:MAG: hypothetical protein GY943_38555 [Chloroflexi bacterium]|nr:hypothetical protein [Chloroflexota bacterium]
MGKVVGCPVALKIAFGTAVSVLVGWGVAVGRIDVSVAVGVKTTAISVGTTSSCTHPTTINTQINENSNVRFCMVAPLFFTLVG